MLKVVMAGYQIGEIRRITVIYVRIIAYVIALYSYALSYTLSYRRFTASNIFSSEIWVYIAVTSGILCPTIALMILTSTSFSVIIDMNVWRVSCGA